MTVGEEGRRLVGHGRELGREVVLEGFPEGPVDRVRVLDARGELLALAVPRGFAPAAPGLARVPVLHPDLVLLAVGPSGGVKTRQGCRPLWTAAAGRG